MINKELRKIDFILIFIAVFTSILIQMNDITFKPLAVVLLSSLITSLILGTVSNILIKKKVK